VKETYTSVKETFQCEGDIYQCEGDICAHGGVHGLFWQEEDEPRCCYITAPPPLSPESVSQHHAEEANNTLMCHRHMYGCTFLLLSKMQHPKETPGCFEVTFFNRVALTVAGD